VMGVVHNLISLIQGAPPPSQPELKQQIGSGPSHRPPAPFPNCSQRNRVGFDCLYFFWLDWQHIRGASRVRCLPQFVPSAWGGAYTVPPRLGRSTDLVLVPTSVRLPICKYHAYSDPPQASKG